MSHAGVKVSKEGWAKYFVEQRKAIESFEELRNREVKLYEINGLVIRCIQEYIVSVGERVSRQYTIQLIQDFGKLDALLLMNERYDDAKKANEAFLRIKELAF